MDNIGAVCNAALKLWVDLTGVDPDAKTRRYYWGETISVHDINDELQEAQQIDPSMLTCCALLTVLLEEYLKNTVTSLKDLLDEAPATEAIREKARELRRLLRLPCVTRALEDFRDGIKAALRQYDVKEDTLKVVDDFRQLALLRRDALRALKELRADWFLDGEKDEAAPQYNRFVQETWNVTSVLHAACASPQGITMVMVTDRVPEASFFILVMRSGGRLVTLTDRPESDHPHQKYMSRRPGKELSHRAYRLHFPYELLDLQEDRRGDLHSIRDKTSLVPIRKTFIARRALRDLADDEVIWTAMVFDLIKSTYWEGDPPKKDLSYTADMCVVKDRLIAAPEVTALAVRNYKTLDLPRLTRADLETSKAIEAGGFNEPTLDNEWIVEKFKDGVDEKALNLVESARGTILALPEKTGGELVKMEPLEPVVDENKPFYWLEQGPDWGKHLSLSAPEATAFGTPAELHRDQVWFARRNQIHLIEKANRENFAKTYREVHAWYVGHVKANERCLLRSLSAGHFVAPGEASDDSWEGRFGPTHEAPKDILHLYSLRDRYRSVMGCMGYYSAPTEADHGRRSREGLHGPLLGALTENCYGYTCYITKGRAEFFAAFFPTTKSALAALAGVEVKDLPEPLQHWSKNEPYSGNPILQRVDPAEWVIENWWRKLPMNVVITLSRRGFRRIVKEFGPPRIDCDWPWNKFDKEREKDDEWR